MIILLYGPDDYRREEKKRFIIRNFQEKHSALGCAEFDIEEEGGYENFLEFVRNRSLFEPVRLAVVRDGLRARPTKEFALVLRELLEAPDITVLLSESEKLVKLFDFLLKKTQIQKFEYLTGIEWKKFIAIEAKKRGMIIPADALTFLAESHEKNTWRLVTALDKIAHLGKTSLSREDIEAQDIEVQPSFWEVFNGLKSPILSARLTSLEYVFSSHEPAAKTFNILSAQWKEKTPVLAEGDLLIKLGKLEYEELLLALVLGA